MLTSAESKTEEGSNVESEQDDESTPRHSPDESLADIRLCFGSYFLVLIAGKERRDMDRLTAERKARPVLSGKNLPLLLIVWGSLIFTFFSIVSYGLKLFIQGLG